MPAGTIYPVFVHVSSPSPGAYAVRCTPASLTVNKGDSNARIVFLLVDETIPDDGGSPVRFVFPDRSGGGPNDDEYDGITIHGDSGRVFTGAVRDPSGLMVTVNDANSSAADYTYTVQVVWGNVTAGVDPGIKNQGP